jgi:hypothetical protein
MALAESTRIRGGATVKNVAGRIYNRIKAASKE